MAGQARRGSRGEGRSSRPGTPSPRITAATAPTPDAALPETDPADATDPATTPAPATRSVYRLLLMKGLAPAEAANLTAFICGLPATDLHWSLTQINQLLFLRRMRQTGHFDGMPEGPTGTS